MKTPTEEQAAPISEIDKVKNELAELKSDIMTERLVNDGLVKQLQFISSNSKDKATRHQAAEAIKRSRQLLKK